MLTEGLYTGIFAGEGGQRWLYSLMRLACGVLAPLHKRHRNDDRAYVAALREVAAWTDERVQSALDRLGHDDLDARCRATFETYVEEVALGDLSPSSAAPPPTTVRFIHTFLVALMKQRAVRNRAFYADQCDIVGQHALCMQSAREALFALAYARRGPVAQASPTSVPERAESDERGPAPAPPTSPVAPRSRVDRTFFRHSPVRDCDEETDMITPDDSVSNIGAYPPPPRAAPARPPLLPIASGGGSTVTVELTEAHMERHNRGRDAPPDDGDDDAGTMVSRASEQSARLRRAARAHRGERS